jgi:hypothetical protein
LRKVDVSVRVDQLHVSVSSVYGRSTAAPQLGKGH